MYLQARQLANQQCMIRAQRVIYPIIFHHASQQTIIKLFCTNPTNQDNLSASINTQKKKEYIRLTAKIVKIVLRVFTQDLTLRVRKLTTLMKVLKN